MLHVLMTGEHRIITTRRGIKLTIYVLPAAAAQRVFVAMARISAAPVAQAIVMRQLCVVFMPTQKVMESAE